MAMLRAVSSLRALLAPRVAAVLVAAVVVALVVTAIDQRVGVAVAAGAAVLAAGLVVKVLLVVQRLKDRVAELTTRLAGVTEDRDGLRRELDERVDAVAERLSGEVSTALRGLDEQMVRLRETVSRVSSDLARDGHS